MKKILITIIIYVFTAKANAQTILLQETFSSGTMPAGWYNDSAGVTPVNGWKFSGAPTVPAGNGFDNNYVRINCGTSNYVNCYLVMSSIDASIVNKVFLTFSHKMLYRTGNNYSYGHIDMSTDGGNNWNQIFEVKTDHFFVKKNIIDVSATAVGNNDVKFRFHYRGLGATTGGWAIDSVVVTDSVPCMSPPDSGFAVSNQLFACTGNNAKVWLDDLADGIGQTYQWQLKNLASGNVWSNIPGATLDTLNHTQNGSTYYRCEVTCGGLSTNSTSIYMVDTPFAPGARGKQIHICTGVDDTLHLLQPYGGANITYQWQVAPWIFDPFVDIPGGTNDTFLVSASQYSGNNYFRCVQTCTSNGAASNSAWVNEIENPNPLCYCMPYNGNPCTNQYYISDVSITSTTLNHSATCIDTIFISFNRYNYQFFNPAIGNTTAILGNGNTYTLNVNTDSLGQRFAMWLDYNGDGNFAPNEWTNGVWVNPGTPGQVQFTVPVNAAQGATGMRIRSTLNWTYDSTMACSNMTGGSTYDYIVTIDSTVGIADLGIEIEDLRLMPNPAKDNLTITALNFTPIHDAQYIITDLAGRILQQEIFTGTATINTTALTPAVYFVTVKDKERSVVRRFVKAP